LKARAVDILKAIKLNTDNLLANGTLKGFTQQSLSAVFSDSTSLARLINAVAFGNYNGNDITKEAVRLAMVKDGHTELANQSLISDTQNKAAYAATDAYKKADALPALAIPGDAAAKIMAATTLGMPGIEPQRFAPKAQCPTVALALELNQSQIIKNVGVVGF
jgi:hypothetical protein